MTTGVLAALGGLAQINPIWIYGPFDPSEVSAASQLDWYIGWLDGALRAWPAWEVRAFGFEIPNPFFPGVLLPSVTFGLIYLWPFLEARWTGDREVHHLLDRPRDRPARTALGVATLAFYIVLFIAGGSDVLSTTFGLSVNQLIWALRVSPWSCRFSPRSWPTDSAVTWQAETPKPPTNRRTQRRQAILRTLTRSTSTKTPPAPLRLAPRPPAASPRSSRPARRVRQVPRLDVRRRRTKPDRHTLTSHRGLQPRLVGWRHAVSEDTTVPR